jgi:hypothetical protein
MEQLMGKKFVLKPNVVGTTFGFDLYETAADQFEKIGVRTVKIRTS